MTTLYMSMSLPIVGVTPGGGTGVSWGPLLTGALGVVDAHDHSAGKGAPLSFTSQSVNVATDLGFNGHSLFNIDNISTIGSITALALTGSLTQVILSASFSGSFTSGTISGSTYIPTGSFIPQSIVSGTLVLGPYLIGSGGIMVSTNSLGQVIVSNRDFDTWTDPGNGFIVTTSSVSIDSQGRLANSVASDIFFFVSGSHGDSKKALFGGDVTASGSIISPTFGFSGSLTTLASGLAYLVSQGALSISTNSLGQVVVSGSGPQVTNLSGTGATTVTNVGTLYVVSSSTPAATQVQFIPLTASNWNPSPTTVAQAISQLAAPNFSASLAAGVSGVVTASVTANIAKAKTGVVNLSGMLVVNPDTTCTGSAQFYRDSTQIGPTMKLSMTTGVPTVFALQWIDTLPDNVFHTYSMTASASLGTLAVSASAGSLTVREIN